MIASRIPLPQSLELVPAEHVRSMIDSADQDISALERELASVNGAADSAEAEIRDRGIDEGSSAWTMVRLQVFLDGLRAEATREAQAVLDLASRSHRGDRHDVARPTSVAPPAFTRHELEVPLGATPRTNGSTPHAEPAPIALTPVAFAADASAPVIDPAPPAPVPPIPVPRHDQTVEVPVVVATVAPPVAVPVDQPADPIVFRDPPMQAPQAPVQAEPARRSLLRRIPVSAILEVAAVLLILVFILLRLS